MDSSSSSRIEQDHDLAQEFQRKVEQSYKLHKESSRPNSASQNRPQSASRFRHAVTSPGPLYSRISSFLQLNPINLRIQLGQYLTSDQLKSGLKNLGLQLSEDELVLIFRDHKVNPKGGIIRVSDLVSKVDLNKKPLQSPHSLVQQAQKLLEDSKPRLAKNLKRPISGSIRTGHSKKGFRPVSAHYSARKRDTQRTRVNYLKHSKNKQQEVDKELALTVDKCKREFEYDCLHKMGQANEIAQNMELPVTYRAIKKENGQTKCHIYENDNFVQEITLENFLREWRKLKRKQKPAINLPTSTSQFQASTLSKTTSAKVNKKERQEELKKLLLETKELTNKLKEQLKILEKKGIIAKSLHSSTAGYSTTYFNQSGQIEN